jgi:hypothetical protein
MLCRKTIAKLGDTRTSFIVALRPLIELTLVCREERHCYRACGIMSEEPVVYLGL